MKRVPPLFATAISVVVVCATALIYSGAALAGSADLNEPSGPSRIALAYVSTTHAVLAGVALQNGYYRQEGLEVAPRTHSFGRSALEDLLQGKADLATVADPPIMMAAMKGEPICVIATIQTSNKDNALVAKKGTGIVDPRDLRGKRIGATFGTTSDFFMEAFLVGNGIAREDVERIDLKPEELQDALLSGRIDAASAFQPFLIRLQKKLGGRAVSFYDETIYTWTFNIVARRKFIRENPKTVQKFLRALLRAEEFVNRNPAEAQKIVADYSGMDIDLVREIWSGMRFSVTLDQFLVLALEDESRWAINSGIIPEREIPNYLDFFYFDGLESVKPKAVRVLGRRAAER